MKDTPKVSILLFCYNQEKYIEQSLLSCLEQDYTNLKIVISDDASTDDTFKIIKRTIEKYSGSHEIITNRNTNNLGIGPHFAHLMDNFADGNLVVMCGGDDISKSNRVSRITEEWLKNGKPSFVAHSLEEINENGITFEDFRTIQYRLQDNSIHSNNMYSLLEYLKFHQPIPFIGAAVAYKVDTYNKFKTPRTFPDYEDHLMYFRSLLSDGIHYFDDILVKYRKHEDSHTALSIKPFYDDNNSMLFKYFSKNNRIDDKYINSYTSHKISVQQWIDYSLAIHNNHQADYQLISNLWENIVRRHESLLQNKKLIEKIFINLRKNIFFKNILKTRSIEYIKPFNTVIFGTSYTAVNVMSKIPPCFNIKLACNSDSSLKGSKFNGLKIIDLKELKKSLDNIDCIIIASHKFYQIKHLLMSETNISANKIIRLPVSILI